MLKFFIILILLYNLNAQLLYPNAENVAFYKPVEISPPGSTCGLETKSSLCDNRYQNNALCSNSSSIINCLQQCPYGNIYVNHISPNSLNNFVFELKNI